MAKEKSSAKEGATKRTRNYTAILYPDSENTPENWLEILQDQQVPMFISPLHDKDTNETTGELKKAHYHIIVCYDAPKTPEQAKELFSLVGAVIPPLHKFMVQSIRGACRYLCHLDNPDKYQYVPEDVKCLCGADYYGAISLVTDKYACIGQMIDYCVENKIYSYATLLIYCRAERMDWFRVLCDNGTMVMKEFLKSLDWTNKQFKDN